MNSITTIIVLIGAAIVASLAFITIVTAISFIFSWPVYMLWNNCLVDTVTGVHNITWLQAWGIGALFAILFRSADLKDSK